MLFLDCKDKHYFENGKENRKIISLTDVWDLEITRFCNPCPSQR